MMDSRVEGAAKEQKRSEQEGESSQGREWRSEQLRRRRSVQQRGGSSQKGEKRGVDSQERTAKEENREEQ
jgi:hypothetical protein